MHYVHLHTLITRHTTHYNATFWIEIINPDIAPKIEPRTPSHLIEALLRAPHYG